MNLFVALVPMLLLSAVFISIAVIDLGAAGAGDAAAAERTPPPTVVITESEIRVGTSATAPPERRIDRAADDMSEQLASALADYRERTDGSEVIIASTSGVRYQDLVSVIDVATQAGFADLALASAETLSSPSHRRKESSNGQ
jgi:biopolymer transport protein ExbD